MDQKFFTFAKPYFSFIDDGSLYRKPFSWLYTLFAIANLIIPIFVMIKAIDSYIFKGPGKFIFVFILLWIIVAFASWIGFQLWWDRKDKVNNSSSSGDDFVATPVFSHFLQTFGEWLGTFIAIVGTGSAILMTLFLGSEGNYMGEQMGLGFAKGGITAIITMPLIGFFIIVFSRFIAEQARALASIANNTKK